MLPPDRPELCKGSSISRPQAGHIWSKAAALLFWASWKAMGFLNQDPLDHLQKVLPQENWKGPWVWAGVPPNLPGEAQASLLLLRCGDWP